MSQAFLSIGSNIERQRYISACLDALQVQFGELLISSVYESEAVGFDGDPFYNLVVGIETELALPQLFSLLRRIEHDNDRCRNAIKFSARTLDIDILTYDDFVGEFRLDDGSGGELPRDEILTNAFVLQPLAEIAPEHLHPESRLSYAELWQRYDKSRQQDEKIRQRLWTVPFEWQGRQLQRN